MAKQYMVERWSKYRVDAFWKRVEKCGENECWNWTGYQKRGPKNPTPYGVLGWKGRPSRAHRVAFELANGEIPECMMVLHTCDNTLCCNPAHLYLGNHAQNMRDMVDRQRRKGTGSGSSNGRSKLTQAQAEEIRALYAAGSLSQDKIAAIYGVSQFAISAIVRNKRYKESQ
jgi:DNA-binding XRE family transcriptional regulator